MRFWRGVLVLTLVACGGKVALEDDFNSRPSQGTSSSGSTGRKDTSSSGSTGVVSSSGSNDVPPCSVHADPEPLGVCHGSSGGYQCDTMGVSPALTCAGDDNDSKCACGANGFTLPYAANTSQKLGQVWVEYCSCASNSSSSGDLPIFDGGAPWEPSTICDDFSNAGCVGTDSNLRCAVTPPDVQRWLTCNGTLDGSGTYLAECSCPIPGSAPDGGAGKRFKISTAEFKNPKYLFSLWQTYCGGVCY